MNNIRNPPPSDNDLEWQRWRLENGTFSMQLKHVPTGIAVSRHYDAHATVFQLIRELKSELASKLAVNPSTPKPEVTQDSSETIAP